jgi:hypothetical protein
MSIVIALALSKSSVQNSSCVKLLLCGVESPVYSAALPKADLLQALPFSLGSRTATQCLEPIRPVPLIQRISKVCGALTSYLLRHRLTY